MTLLIAPLFTAGIAIGNFQDANAGNSITPPGFYGSSPNGDIFLFDPSIPSVTPLGNTVSGFGSTEIECTSDGICFSQGRDGSFIIEQVGLNPPFVAGPPVFDVEAFNGLEYVGTTLFGTSIVFSCLPSTLSTLDPLTGLSVPIGPTFTGRPMSGLAYDTSAGIMYGVDGCNFFGPSALWTVDLNTGFASPVGNTGLTLGSLEFGPDGQLYAGGDGLDGGNLYQIDTNTGVATLVISSGFGAVTGLTLVPSPTIDVDIDIKPGSDPNSINPKSNGVVPIGLLGSATFDVTDVDVTTLMFGTASPAHDLADPDTYNEHIQDVNDDGFDDLVSHYKQKETGIACGDTEATLTGTLLDGTPIVGSDSVRTVPCK